MTRIELRAATADDSSAIVAMNHAVVDVTSPMDESRLAAIVADGANVQVALCDGDTAGFLMTLPAGCRYSSSNYQWFDARLKAFLYIDRIVISARHRGAGIGSKFYRHAIDQARARQLHWLAAEMNIRPPNDTSLAFHRKHGFVEIGQQTLAADKTVSMQLRAITTG